MCAVVCTHSLTYVHTHIRALHTHTHTYIRAYTNAHTHSVIKTDDFTRRLFEIYEEVRHDNRQASSSLYLEDKTGCVCVRRVRMIEAGTFLSSLVPSLQTCALGMHRSDYMVDLSGGDGNLCLRQIELNTIASSFFGLTSRLKEFHE